jgi:hypothetical protein
MFLVICPFWGDTRRTGVYAYLYFKKFMGVNKMNMDEFIHKLEKLSTSGWQPFLENGMIRLRPSPMEELGKYDPITALCAALGRGEFTIGEYRATTYELHIAPPLVVHLVNSIDADTCSEDELLTRGRIIKALGLKSEIPTEPTKI